MSEAQTWDGFAARYDRIVTLFDGPYDEVRARAVASLRGRARALEVAAGTGQFTLELASAVQDLIATDISPEMVARLAQRLDGEGATHARAVVMSAYALDVPDAHLDAIFCANALHVMERPDDALAELHRALAPGGLLIIPTFLHHADLARRALSRVMSLTSSFIAHTRYDLATLTAAVERAGFTVRTSAQLPGLLPIGYVEAVR